MLFSRPLDDSAFKFARSPPVPGGGQQHGGWWLASYAELPRLQQNAS